MSKLVVVLGPTASGKTQLATKLAYKFKGEIISADSRQVYQSMDIGTGKDLDEYKINNTDIQYHLIDILNPKEDYSVFKYKNDFLKIYQSLQNQNILPILCGGTGLYIESVLLNYQILVYCYQSNINVSNYQNLSSLCYVIWKRLAPTVFSRKSMKFN